MFVNNKTSRINNGFSLLEVVIYISLLAVMLVFVVNTSISMSKAFALNRVIKNINTSAISSLDRMTYEIRRSTGVNIASSILGTSPGKLVLDTTDGSGMPITVEFYVENNALKLRDGGVEIGSLFSENILASNLVFDVISTTNSEAVKITLGLEGVLGTQTQSKVFYAVATTR